MKKTIAFFIAVIMLLALSACGGGTAPAAEEPAAEQPAAEEPAAAPEAEEAPAAEEAPEEVLEETPEEAPAAEEEETAIFNGKEYVKLFTIVCDSSLTTTDPQFDQYFREGNAEDGVRAIVKAGNVFVNGQQIPYIQEDGTLSAEELVVGGDPMLWQVDGGWAWKAHIQRQWNDAFFMPSAEPGFVAGTPLELEEAAFMLAKHIAYMVGQTVELYAEPGDDFASVISTTYYNSTLVGDVQTENGIVHVFGADGQDIGIEFPEENFDPAIQPEDMMVYWLDSVQGWMAKRASSAVGRLVENTDPEDEEANKHPFFLPEGETELITTGDSYIGKSFPEAFRHTQFIRGERRTDQYNNEDEVIIMWSSDDGEDHVIGFTRGDGAPAALAHAVAYAEEVTKDIVVSEDGSDVPADQYWINPEAWDAFQETLSEAKAMVEGGTASNLACDQMIFDLGNVLGGTEDLHSNGPLKMNPLGVMGSMEPGAME